jgi:hypothetical protein
MARGLNKYVNSPAYGSHISVKSSLLRSEQLCRKQDYYVIQVASVYKCYAIECGIMFSI